MRPAFTILLLLLAWPGEASAFLPAPVGGTVSAPLPDRPLTLDPVAATRESELQLVTLLYDGLFRLGPQGQPQPHLVQPGAGPSEDGKSWRLQLLPGIRLHDGRTLTPAMVAAALKRLRRSSAGYLLAPVSSITLDKAGAVVLASRRSLDQLPWLLCAPEARVAVPARRGKGWVGSGPFRLKWFGKAGADLRAHEDHFAGRPYIDLLRLRVFERAAAEVAAFQVGTIQLSMRGTSLFGRQPRRPYRTLHGPPSALVYLGVSRRQSYMRDTRFRRALLKAIDTRRLGRLAGTGAREQAVGPVSARLLPARGGGASFDREGARKLLSALAAQYPAMRPAGGRVRLSLLVDRSRGEDRMVAGQLVADLDRVGLALSLDPQPAAEVERRRRSGAFDLLLSRVPLRLPYAPVAVATVMAQAGLSRQASRCMNRGRCGARQARQLMRQLPLVPLVHVSTKVAHDADLLQARLTPGGLIDYVNLYRSRAP